MSGRGSRLTVGALAVVSAICIVFLALIIWLGTADTTCSKLCNGSTVPPTSTPPPDRFPDHVALPNLKLDVTNGRFIFQHGGEDAMSGIFKDISSTNMLSNCSATNNAICIKAGNGYEMRINSFSLTRDEGGVKCHEIRQSYPLLARDDITTCIDYGAHHWYGAAEVHDQHWPIEQWSIELQEFVTRDPYHPGYFGSVQERYWLSSGGAAIHVPFRIPLFVSMNASGDQQLCFVSKFKNSVYRNIDKEDLKLSFHVCTGENLTSLHTNMANHFWKKPSATPHIETMIKPIWSTWAIYKKNINASSVIEYADRILEYNLSISQLEIDDDWTLHYGDWTFDTSKFPNAALTMTELQSKVPAISMWIHPFINTDSDAFSYTSDRDMLMKITNPVKHLQVPGLLKWWNPGLAGLLDFSNGNTTEWFLGKLGNLQANYSVNSFKFDAGEIVWMPSHTDMSRPYFHPSEYIKYYVDLAVQSDKSERRQEVRVGCLTQDAPVLVRMLDRRSRWGVENGLRTLIPTALTFGLLGYPFVLPDMIGGNAYGVSVEMELYVRWLQINVFLPAIQFSIPPWHFNDSKVIGHAQDMLQLRESYTDLFTRLSNEAVEHGWPIVRPLWWIAPQDPACHVIDDQFLLGDDLLVAPIVEKHARQRNIYIPAGHWLDKLNNDTVLEGGEWYTDYQVSLWQLPYFVRVNS